MDGAMVGLTLGDPGVTVGTPLVGAPVLGAPEAGLPAVSYTHLRAPRDS